MPPAPRRSSKAATRADPMRETRPISFMLAVLAALAAAALAGAPAAAEAQVYPERIRSLDRTRIPTARAERYQRNSDREEKTEQFTKTVKLGANGAVDVSNIAGDITITRGNGSDAVIEVTKRARARTPEEAQELLQLVQVEITDRAGRTEIRTKYPNTDELKGSNRRNFNVSVSYAIAVPQNARVTAKSISGNLSARDVRGEIVLETISGDVQIANAGRIASAKTVSGDLEISGTEIEGALDASTISGDLRLRKVRANRMDLGSVSGNVMLEDLECDRVSAHAISGNVVYGGALAHGGRYELASHSGEVRMTIGSGTGFEVNASSFSGTVRSEFDLQQQDQGRRRQSLRGVFGDGSAVLDLTTFSGTIVLVKR
jgi:DUF4097 and DUF4098 domain-containing protein YvlB